MKIAVVGGAGAMGGVWAGGLHAAGHEVAILDVAAEAIAVIHRDGLTIEEADGSSRGFWIAATDNAAAIGPCDAVIVLTKAGHTRAAIERALPAIDARTTVLTLQNGWGNAETLAETVPAEQIVMGVTYHGATLLAPGRVLHTLSGGPTFIGPLLDGAPLDRAEAIGRAMTEGGIRTTVTAAVKTEVWKKLIVNSVGLPVAALTRLASERIGADAALLRVIDELAAEAVRVARAKGYAIDLDDRIAAMRAVLAKGNTGKASMLQDVEAQRRTEIDATTGAIVREAESLGIDVPLHRAMLALVKGLQSSWWPK
ncbi:MAG: 2-dehydropantoate 2-reductase [Thermomicrobiales bacterium]|nr:2-dehydropantoate 2-reductase [Thermomicrobiales bacterium]